MPSRDLRAFLVELDAQGQLTRVKVPISPEVELAAVAAHAEHHLSTSPALMFEQVSGSPFRVVTNLACTADHMALALHVRTLDDMRTRTEALFDFKIPQGAMGIISRLAELMNIAQSIGITSNPIVRNPPIYDHVHRESLDVSLFPAVKLTADESHTSFTHALIVAYDKESRANAIYTTRAAVINRDTLALRLPKDAEERMIGAPAAVVLGVDPAFLWSAHLPLPVGFDPAVFAGWLRGRAIPQANGVTQSVTIPADAEAVFEGVLTGETHPVQWIEEGALVTETVHRFHVTAIAHRERAIIPVQFSSPGELFWSRRAVERLLIPLLKTVIPRLSDLYHLSADHAVAHVRAAHKEELLRVGYAIWGIIPHLKRLTVINEFSATAAQALKLTETGATDLSRDEALQSAASMMPLNNLPPLPRVWEDYGLKG